MPNKNLKIIESYFFKYAFPCAHIILQKGRISEKEYKNLKSQFENGKVPSRKTLEMVFEKAFKRIKKFAKKINKDCWDFETIHKYWKSEHNRIINNSEEGYKKVSNALKDICKIHIAKVIDKKKCILTTEYNNQGKKEKRPVFNTLVSDAKIGDWVTIHYGYAIEFVNKSEKPCSLTTH